MSLARCLDSSVRELVAVFSINDEIHTRQGIGAGKWRCDRQISV